MEHECWTTRKSAREISVKYQFLIKHGSNHIPLQVLTPEPNAISRANFLEQTQKRATQSYQMIYHAHHAYVRTWQWSQIGQPQGKKRTL